MPPAPYPSASPARVPIAEIGAGLQIIAGRLILSPGGVASLVDASGQVRLSGEGAATLPAGALVEATGRWDEGCFAVESHRLLLTPRPGSGPPSGLPPASALRARAVMNRALRAWLDARGFVEVETPTLVPSPGTDVYLEAFQTRFVGLGDFPAAELYLHTSPEFAMKRLLAAGMERIYQLGRCYRQGEATAWHNPEFSMLEFYRAYADCRPIMEDVEGLVRAACGPRVQRPGREPVELEGAFERLPVREAFLRYCEGLDVLEHDTAASLRAAAESRGLALHEGGGWDDLFHELLVLHVEPRLGVGRPTFLTDYPAPLAVLARRRADDPRLAERFELYVDGVELCNGFTELNDPVEQRARFAEDLARRRERGLPPYPMPEAFLDALAWGLPPSGGVALGLDRLLMLRLGVEDIGEVLIRSVPARDSAR